MTGETTVDDWLVVAGGGLHGCLLALTAHSRYPEKKITVIEPRPDIGGNHTWCHHPIDVPEHLEPIVRPLVEQTWKAYDVSFPGRERQLQGPYTALTSHRLNEHVRSVVSKSSTLRIIQGRVAKVEEDFVELDDGSRYRAQWTVDARGGEAPQVKCAYQHFLGLEVDLETPHGLDHPRLMDASVEQIGGFRFVYTLPFSPTRLLIEDTVYSEESSFSHDAFRERVRAYADENGWTIRSVVREEFGSLPLPLEVGDAQPPKGSLKSPIRAGYGAGWFHPTTGYSVPVAVRFCDAVVEEMAEGRPRFEKFATSHAQQFRFACKLNRMMFRMYKPADRRGVLARFYRLSEPLVNRFYSLQMTRGDRLRVLCGRPPEKTQWRHAMEVFQ